MHIYKSAAGLSDASYRQHLLQAAGRTSAKDPAWTEPEFESAMAALETTLFLGVAAECIPDPRPNSRHIVQDSYWRSKAAKPGQATSRQYWSISQAWQSLSATLPAEVRSLSYLSAILHKACPSSVSLQCLTFDQASALIDALQDRLAHVRANQADPIPF